MRLDDDQREKRTRLDAIWFQVGRWEETRKFYREVLGLKEVQVDQDGGKRSKGLRFLCGCNLGAWSCHYEPE